jgi:hypothetical protein
MRRLFALRLAIWTGIIIVSMSVLFGLTRIMG